MQTLKHGDPSAAGPYRLAGRLGAGGMGVVYLGISATADRFAIKVISPGLVSDDEFRARFAAEVEVLRTVSGTRIARLERADLGGTQPWLATEFVPGRSLDAHVEASGPLDQREGAMLGALLVEGLRSVHAAGLIHRDLKPANIMLGPNGPIVIDFGLAVLRERDVHMTGTGQPVGTPAYMSPEQARGERDLTTASDVYALGATLVYALTGHRVYEQASPLALLRRIDDPLDLPNTEGVPDDLRSLVNAMLGYDAGTRPTLDQAFARFITVATAGGVPAEEVRTRLAATTYQEEKLELPDWTDDPTEEDSDVGTHDDDPTRLVTLPRPQPVVREEPDAGPPSPVPAAEVGWLVEEMRTFYARKATL
jgi:serine/threonine protein kinase